MHPHKYFLPFFLPNFLHLVTLLVSKVLESVVLLQDPKPMPKPRLFAKTVHYRNLDFTPAITGGFKTRPNIYSTEVNLTNYVWQIPAAKAPGNVKFRRC